MVESTRLSLTAESNAVVASATDVIERPSTGVVLTIASGQRAGEMIGTDENEFLIGYHPDCFVRFSPSQYPDANARLLFRRGREGWSVTQVSGDPAFVNQRMVNGKVVLRSGDIVRFSGLGPDVQFTLQSGGLAVKSLVHRFLPRSPLTTHPAVPNLTASELPSHSNAAPIAPRNSDSVSRAAGVAGVRAVVPVAAVPVRPPEAIQVQPAAAVSAQATAATQTQKEFASAAAADVMNAVRSKRTIAGLPIWLVMLGGVLSVAVIVWLVLLAIK